MLHFFRKYQKIIFYIVTIVIITSFIFFGTYQAFTPQAGYEKETTAYVTQAGKKIGSRYFRQLCTFLKAEPTSGRDLFDGNFLSDSLISREFLETGLALDVVAKNPERYRPELDERLERERHYTPYVHPRAPQIAAQAVWDLFSPNMTEGLKALQASQCGLSSMEARVALFNAQRRFPPQFLANMLRYQERDLKGVQPDVRLAKGDVEVFGYQDLEDWFGNTFIERIAQIVIETVAIAKQKGYRVSKEEAASEMAFKSQQVYEALKEQMELPPHFDRYALLTLFMRQHGYDEKTLTELYRDLLLFKRFIHDASDNVVLDPLPFEGFYEYAGQSVILECTQMPKALRFKTREELKAFECYLAALQGDQKDLLSLPTAVHPREELVCDRYELYVGKVTLKQLEAKVTVKETWRWEEEHLEELREQFPYLKRPSVVLDQLEPAQRETIDAFARGQIAQSHPEWMEEAVRVVEMTPLDLYLAHAGATVPLDGISDVKALKEALDHHQEIFGYTQDHAHFYRLLVQNKEKDVLLTFEQAKEKGVLNALHTKVDSEARTAAVIAQIQSQWPELTEQEAIAYRFYSHLTSQASSLEQFAPVTEQKTIDRTKPSFLSYDQVVMQESGEGVAEQEGAYRYRVLEQRVDKTLPVEKMLRANELLSKEVRRSVLKKLV